MVKKLQGLVLSARRKALVARLPTSSTRLSGSTGWDRSAKVRARGGNFPLTEFIFTGGPLTSASPVLSNMASGAKAAADFAAAPSEPVQCTGSDVKVDCIKEPPEVRSTLLLFSLVTYLDISPCAFAPAAAI